MVSRWMPALAASLAVLVSACGSPVSPSAQTPASTVPVPPPTTAAVSLEIKSFSVIEFQETVGLWEYAPRIQVVETSGRTGVTVTRMAFTFEGFHGPGPWLAACKRVEPGDTRELLGDGYGTYEVTVDQTGSRASGATVVLTVVDDHGATGTVVGHATVTPGQLPPYGPATHSQETCAAPR